MNIISGIQNKNDNEKICLFDDQTWKNHGHNDDVNTAFHNCIFYLWPNTDFEPYAVTILKRPNGKSPGN